ncbi:MAG TPA: OmpA family protein [Bacteroidales bacterium]|nr:OmpA family protein [Bacteroidales bacterium]
MTGKTDKKPHSNIFRTPLVNVINMKHELAELAQQINWKSIENDFAPYYSDIGCQALKKAKQPVGIIEKQDTLRVEQTSCSNINFKPNLGGSNMKKLKLIFAVIFMMSTTITFAQRTSDIEGGKDYPAISRFTGSVIEFYKETNWGSYKLPLNDKNAIDWKNPMTLEGKVIRIQYTTSKENSEEFVLHNYKSAFSKAGYKVLTAIANEELGVGDRPHTWRERYYETGGYYNGLNNEKFGLGLNFPNWKPNHSFIVARGKESDKEIYAIVYTVVDNNYTLITLDVVEIEAVETGLVSVDDISGDLTNKGHIAIYDIHFEVGKSTIMPESQESLKIIADYLNANKDKKYFIVGHTDNTGDFASNMTLSEERAKSVMSELITKYNVGDSQLKSYGVSSLSPVSSNNTEEGRAKNRRVEIVEQ